MLNIQKTILNPNLRTPDSIDVECGKHKKRFPINSFANIEAWLVEIWEKEKAKNPFIPLSKARVYYNIDWDSDHVLYCAYTAEWETKGE